MAFRSPWQAIAEALPRVGEAIARGIELNAEQKRQDELLDRQLFLNRQSFLEESLRSALSQPFLPEENVALLESELAEVRAASNMSELQAAEQAFITTTSQRTTPGRAMEILPEGTRRLPVPSGTISVTQETPTTITGLAARAARVAGVREREFELAQQQAEREFVLSRDQLQRLHDLQMQNKDADYRAELARLASELNISEAEVSADLQAARDQKLFDQTLSLEEVRFQEQRLKETIASYKETGSNFDRAILESMSTNTQLPEYIRNEAAAALTGDVTLENEAYMARLEAEIAGYERDEALAPIELERAQKALKLLDTEIKIAGQQITLNDLTIAGSELANARAEFENTALQFETGQEYVSRAISLGLPARIQALIDVFNSGDTSDPLWKYVENATLAELDEALKVADESKNLAGRERSLAEAEFDRAYLATMTGEFEDRANFVDAMAQGYSPDELQGMIDSGQFQLMIDSNVITQTDLDAMKRKSGVYRVLENDTVNAPRVQALNDRLSQWGDPAKFPDVDDPEALRVAEDGLRTTLNGLVGFGYMDATEVEGLVELYTNAWRNQDNLFALTVAEAEAQLAQLRSATALNNARAAVEAAGPGEPQLDASYINATRQVIDSVISAIKDEAEAAGCTDDVGRFLASEDVCVNFQARINEQTRTLLDLTSEILGRELIIPDDIAPTVSALDDIRRLMMIEVRDENGNLIGGREMTMAEQVALDTLIEGLGGEQAVSEMFGFVTSESETPPQAPAPAPATGDGATGEGGGGFLGGVRAAGEAVGSAVMGAAEAGAAGLEAAGEVVGTGIEGLAEGARGAFGGPVGAVVGAAQGAAQAGADVLGAVGEAGRETSIGPAAEEPGIPGIPGSQRDLATPLSVEQGNQELASLNIDAGTLRSDYQTLVDLRNSVFNRPVGTGRRPSAAQSGQLRALLAKYNLPYSEERWDQSVEVFMRRYGNLLQ